MKQNSTKGKATKYWMIAPMEASATKLFETAWEYDKQHGTIAIGWCCNNTTLQNVSQFGDIQEFQTELKKAKLGWGMIVPKTIWDFHCNIRVNDIIIARRGFNEILGIGIVTKTAYYDLAKGEKRISVSSLVTEKQQMHIKPRFVEVFWAITGRFPVRLEPKPRRIVHEITSTQYQKVLGLLGGAGDAQYRDIREAIGINTEIVMLANQSKRKQKSAQGSKPNYYIGIDFGTTNSIMAWGAINPRTNQLEPKIVPINMMTEYYEMQKKELLPSCVYFEAGQPPNVGEYAKKMLQRQPDRVIKSLKKEMGTRKQFNFDDLTYSPTEISAQILRHLAATAKSHFGFIPENTIITIPAYFDFNMRAAIVEAARLAGFQTRKRLSPILLAEPQAILLNRINQENRGETDEEDETSKLLINSHEPKLILIFDLGGGPLKVSLHKVSYHPKQDMLFIEDIAISRYTQLNGDDFDRELAVHFLKNYVSDHSLILDESQRDLLMNTFQEYAEQAKIELSEQIEFERDLGNWDPNISMTPTIIRKPFEDKEFRYNLSLNEYERIIQRFLAPDMTLDAVDQFNTVETRDNNIIYPILDVLRKGRDRIGKLFKINAVLLNGGMTKLYTIQKRLRNLFGFPPLVVQDPDGAVARGAVIYHHKLYQDDLDWGLEQPQRIFFHQKLKPPQSILNKTVGIGMEERETQRLIHLVKSGAFLPMVYPECFDLPVEAGKTSVKLIFEIGRETKAKLPVVREIQFSKPLKEKDTPLSIQVRIDENGILSLKGYPKDNPDRGLLAMEVNIESLIQENYVKPQINASRYLNIDSEVAELATNFKRLMLTNDLNVQKVILDRIETQGSRIIQNVNAEKFIIPLCDLVSSLDNFGKMLTVNLLGDLAVVCSQGDPIYEIYEVTAALISLEKLKTNGRAYVNSVARSAVEAIGKTRLSLAKSSLFNLLNLDEASAIRSTVIYSIGKCCDSIDAVDHLKSFIDHREDTNRIAANWALGKIGSREKDKPLSIQELTPFIPSLTKQLETECHDDIKRNSVYALSEICDRRKCANDIVSIGTAAEVILQLVRFLTDQINNNLSDLASSKSNSKLQETVFLAIQMIRGIDLSSDEEGNLRAIREEN